MKFNNEHGYKIPDKDKFCNQKLNVSNMFNIYQKFMGGGMSQNYGAVYFLEYYIQLHGFRYVVEIGSCKGALSLYLANYAAATEQFLFHTFEIDKKRAWNNRAVEGVGHWFENIELISEYIKSFECDIFSDAAKNIIKYNMTDRKTLIICDGGNKAKEFNVYAPMTRTGDRIIVHDWNVEIFYDNIRETMKNNNIVFDPINNDLLEFNTTLFTFMKD